MKNCSFVSHGARFWALLAALTVAPGAALAQEEHGGSHQAQDQSSQHTPSESTRAQGTQARGTQTQRQQEMQPRQQRQQQQQQAVVPTEQDRQQLRQVSGDVLRIKTVRIMGTDQTNLVALIETQRGERRLAVDLGPAEDARQLGLTTGDRLAVEGRVYRIGDDPLLVATRVRSGNQSVQIDRSEQQQHASQQHQQQTQQRVGQAQPQPMEAQDDETDIQIIEREQQAEADLGSPDSEPDVEVEIEDRRASR
jgi:hypothetical protein